MRKSDPTGRRLRAKAHPRARQTTCPKALIPTAHMTLGTIGSPSFARDHLRRLQSTCCFSALDEPSTDSLELT